MMYDPIPWPADRAPELSPDEMLTVIEFEFGTPAFEEATS